VPVTAELGVSVSNNPAPQFLAMSHQPRSTCVPAPCMHRHMALATLQLQRSAFLPVTNETKDIIAASLGKTRDAVFEVDCKPPEEMFVVVDGAGVAIRVRLNNRIGPKYKDVQLTTGWSAVFCALTGHNQCEQTKIESVMAGSLTACTQHGWLFGLFMAAFTVIVPIGMHAFLSEHSTVPWECASGDMLLIQTDRVSPLTHTPSICSTPSPCPCYQAPQCRAPPTTKPSTWLSSQSPPLITSLRCA